MNDEELLRQALREEAGQLPAPDPAAVNAIAAAAGRRRLARISAVALACMAVVGVTTFAAVRTEGGSTTEVETRPADPGDTSSSTSTTTSASTTTASGGASEDGRPAFAIGLSRKGRVVVLDSSTSRALRVLAEYPVDGERELRGVSLTADRETVYFGYGSTSAPCGAAVYRVAVDGGSPPQKVADGFSPELSPDGRLLAYAAAARRFATSDEHSPCANVLVIRELSTGAERVWLSPADDNYFSRGEIGPITWAPDSKRLAFGFQYENSGVYVVDANRRGGRLDDLEALRAGDDELLAPAWRSSGKIVVASICCHPDYEKPRQYLAIDPDTGESAPFAAPGDFVSIDFDTTGRYLLYIGSRDKGDLFRQDEGEPPVSMASDFWEAEW